MKCSIQVEINSSPIFGDDGTKYYENSYKYVQREALLIRAFGYISQKYVWYIAKKMKYDIINVEYMWIGKRRTYE